MRRKLARRLRNRAAAGIAALGLAYSILLWSSEGGAGQSPGYGTVDHMGPFHPPGHLIDLGTHRLHIWCRGEVEPTVVIDSGLGGFSLEWDKIQDDLSSEMRVCTYDRAGYGWSDPGPQPRTTYKIVEELRALLTLADVPGPYILVGHSFGGYNVQYFAKSHPEATAGIVLVDSSHPDQFDYFPAITRFKTKGPKGGRRTLFSRARLPERYPYALRELGLYLMRTSKAVKTYHFELVDFEANGKQLHDPRVRLPNVPLVVISRGRRVWPYGTVGERKERAWRRLQDELTRLTDRSRHLIAEYSGHYIHLDQPLLVEDAILAVANQARHPRR